MAEVDKLVVKIAAEFGELKRDLEEVKRGIKGVGTSAKKGAKSFDSFSAGLATAAKRAGAAAVAIVGVSSAINAMNSSINRSRELTQFASIAGVSRERFSELEVAVRRFGATGDDLADVMKDLNVRITDAAENGAEYGNVLRKIGLDAAELVKLSPEQQMLAFADALSKANDQGQRFSLDELSDSAVKLKRFFGQGAEKINEMTDGIRSAGQSLTEADFGKLDEAAEAQQKLTAAFERFADILTIKLGPLLSTVFTGLADALEAVTGEAKKMNEEMAKTAETVSVGGLEEVTLYAEESLTMWQEYWQEMAEVRAAGSEMLVAAGEQYRLNELQKEKDAARENTKIWEAGLKGRLSITSKLLGQMATLMNTNSRKQFEIGKAAAIAQVAIDTPKAAMSAYSAMAGIPVVGPALGGIAAAAAVATGVAQIQNIKSQSFGGGGGGAGGAIDAGGGAQGAQAGGGGDETLIDATFNIQSESGNVSADQIRGVAAGLNELIEDGGKLRSVTVI